MEGEERIQGELLKNKAQRFLSAPQNSTTFTSSIHDDQPLWTHDAFTEAAGLVIARPRFKQILWAQCPCPLRNRNKPTPENTSTSLVPGQPELDGPTHQMQKTHVFLLPDVSLFVTKSQWCPVSHLNTSCAPTNPSWQHLVAWR